MLDPTTLSIRTKTETDSNNFFPTFLFSDVLLHFITTSVIAGRCISIKMLKMKHISRFSSDARSLLQLDLGWALTDSEISEAGSEPNFFVRTSECFFAEHSSLMAGQVVHQSRLIHLRFMVCFLFYQGFKLSESNSDVTGASRFWNSTLNSFSDYWNIFPALTSPHPFALQQCHKKV